ncbi:MAG: hypothetical protein LBM71_03600 [Elusimicrobiota bacterium]|jgi:hypothetical protein|nr:hypothetical protein [Elusimicrobiota bacterium]
MKKLISIALILCLTPLLNAQKVKQTKKQTQKHTTVQQDMRITQKDGEEVISFFPSAALGEKVRITVIYPADRATDGAGYITQAPSVYLLGSTNLTKEDIKAIFYSPKDSKKAAKNNKTQKNSVLDQIFVSVAFKTTPTAKQLYTFITEELLPYFELNNGASSLASARTIAAFDDKATALLENAGQYALYASNFALLFFNDTPLPAIKNKLPLTLSIWASGSLSNMARLQTLLEVNGGLTAPNNFAYKISEVQPQEDAAKWGQINFNYLLLPEDRQVVKTEAFISEDKISVANFKPFNFWVSARSKGGYVFDYITTNPKIAPPFFTWDYNSATLDLIYGAQPISVKISQPLPFAPNFSANIKLRK